MGWKCCVPGCRSGYDYAESKANKISFFSFPPDPDLKEEWKIKLQRPDWDPFPNSRICSVHFTESDFQIYSIDSKARRKKSGLSEKLQRLKLLPNAVPSIFSNIYASKENQVIFRK